MLRKMLRLNLSSVLLVVLLLVGIILIIVGNKKEEGTKYLVLTEPVKDSLDVRIQVTPRSNHIDGSRTLNSGQLTAYKVGVLQKNDGDLTYKKSLNQKDGNLMVSNISLDSKQNAVVQIDTNILRMIEEIEQSDDGAGQALTVETVANFSCPDSPRIVNGVEDLLCMKPPSFLPGHRNPCWLDGDRRFHCMPYFQVIGMDKCGSTDLFDRIAQHPDVVHNTGTLGKETMWWSWKRYGHWLNFKIKILPFKAYLQYFSPLVKRIHNQSTSSLITGDGTPMDMWDMSGWTSLPQNEGLTEPKYITPHLIKHINPAVKLLVILRDPTERLFSDYFFLKVAKLTREAFHDEVVKAIKLLHKCTRTGSLRKCLYDRTLHVKSKARLHLGFYSVFLRDWLRVFPRNQFHILRNEDYASDINHHLTDVYKFLNLRPLGDVEMSRISSASRKHVTKKRVKSMLDKTRVILDRLYERFNIQIADMLGDTKYLWRTTTSNII